jgi:LPXTG-motif cell wall-anchored protein
MNTTYRHFRWPLVALWIALLIAMLGFVTSLKAQTGPTLTLISPKDGDTVDGPVIIRVQHSSIRFDGVSINKNPQPQTGHWHIYIDGKYAGLSVTDVEEIPNDSYPTISAGQHTLKVELQDNRHVVLGGANTTEIKLNFSKDVSIPVNTSGPPTLNVLTLTEGTTTTMDGPLLVRVQHSGIRFDGTLVSKDPVPGVGHYHINVDGKYGGLSDSDVIEIPNDAMPTIKAGPHTVMLNLHENNHASTNPPVEHSFQIVATKDISVPNMPPNPPSTSGMTMAGATTTAGASATTGATSTAVSTTGLPNTGEADTTWMIVLLAVGACVVGGGLLVYRSRDKGTQS